VTRENAAKWDLGKIAARFTVEGEYIEGRPWGNGHINDTFAIWMRRKDGVRRYILQRINHEIFRNVPALMENVERVTSHIRRKLENTPGANPDREVLTLVPVRSGGTWMQWDDGTYWRCYLFIENASTCEVVERPEQAFEAARAFGTFTRMLRDLPPPRLHDTIPDFHHTPKRFEALERAIRRDALGRTKEARAEIEFAMARADITDVLIKENAAGAVPERVTHNDTKLNNVMLDDRTGRGVCVIDLDTVMPGLALYDFGDMVRTSTCTGAEDEQDLRLVQFRMEFFEALVRGYLEAIGRDLTPREIELLAFSGRLITFEIGIRFLTDFLEGDVYFKVHRPAHNLDRARGQFRRVSLMEKYADEMEEVVRRCARTCGV